MDAFLSIHRVLASVTAHRSIAVRRPFAAESIDRRVRWFGKLKIPHLRCYGARAVLSLCARTARAVTCRIDQAPELGQMPSPPLVDLSCSDAIQRHHRFQLITPSAPVAVKRVHAAGHVESRINKCCAGQAVFLFETDVGAGHK